MKWLISAEKFQKGKRFEHHFGKGFEPPDKEGRVRLKKPVRLIDKSFIIYEDARETRRVHLKASFTLGLDIP